MKFGFPKRKINETTWFTNDEDAVCYGIIQLITLALSADDCVIWYTIVDEKEHQCVINEDQLIGDNAIIPVPKFNIGDSVIYQYKEGSNKLMEVAGRVDSVVVSLYEGETFTVQYYMEDDMAFPIDEDSIISFDPRNFNYEDEDQLNVIDATGVRQGVNE